MNPAGKLREWRNPKVLWTAAGLTDEPTDAGSQVYANIESDTHTLVRLADKREGAWLKDKPWISTDDGEQYSWSDIDGDVLLKTIGDVPVVLIRQRRLSRPCYDKYYRCPGRAGGGMHYTAVDRCPNGSLNDMNGRRLWRFRFNTCKVCNVIVLPYYVRVVDPTNWGWCEISRWAKSTWTWKFQWLRRFGSRLADVAYEITHPELPHWMRRR